MAESLVGRLRHLDPARRRLIVRALAEKGIDTTRLGPLPAERPAGRTVYRFPASYAQRRLWFVERLSPRTPTYHVSSVFRLRGPLDVGSLAAALADLEARHETLRTRLVEAHGEPWQEILPPHRRPLPVVDLELAGRRAIELARRWCEVEVRRPFALSRRPLWRRRLVRIGSQEHLLVLVFHHLIVDGWSLGILFHDLETLYAAHRCGRPSPLGPLDLQYADHALWQHEQIAAGHLDEQIETWRRRLKGLVRTDLPRDTRPPVHAGRTGGRVPVEVAAARVMAAVERWGGERGVTPFMVIVAAWACVLSRRTGCQDVSVGTPVANRGQLAAEPLVGLFVNTLVLRFDLSGNPSFSRLVERCREIVLEAFENQEVPFERLVEELRPARMGTRQPLFQTMVALQNAGTDRLRLDGLDVATVAVEPGTSRFDALLNLFLEEDGRMSGYCEFSAECFEKTTVRRLLRELHQVLAVVADDPDGPLEGLPLPVRSELHQVRFEWNDSRGATGNAGVVAVPELLGVHALRQPDAVAVADERVHLTYGELVTRARRLAARLLSHGIGPESLVALWLEAGADWVVAALGVLEAGAAYLPLDLADPPPRVSRVLGEALPDLLLVSDRARLALRNLPPVLRLDALADGPEASGTVDPEQLAYVLYTSGSTGRPKGVEIPHRGLSNLVAWHREAFGVGPGVRGSHVASLGFDAAVWEIWGHLAAGVTLAVPPAAARRSLDDLGRWLRRHGVTVAFLPTPLAEAMMEAELVPETLRLLLTGGDRLHARPRRGLGATLVNAYGPTEASVVTTAGTVTRGASGAHPPSIGRPVDGVEVLILDSALRPQAIGAPGELFVGGASIARGYRRRAAWTAERFLPHPWSERPGARFYATGDRARWRADGRLDFLERLDDQVQVRGQRIELGEVEAALLEHPQVQAAAARLWGARLVAYVIVRPASQVETSALRSFLARRLPGFMVPAVVTVLDALPLRPSGKVDRDALPEPAGGALAASGSGEPPRGGLERKVAAIWCDLLEVERVGREDDFFALGGHSLLAMRLASRVGGELGRPVEVRELFEHPTLSGYAAAVERAGTVQRDATIPRLSRRTEEPA